MQLERRVKLLERESRSAPLTYNRFTQNPESVLARNMGPFLFIDTVPALKAHVAKLNAFYPLELLRWVDTNAKDPSLPPEEAEDAENAESEGEGDSQRAVKRRNRCPMKRPEDAVVLWLFILRTGSTFEQTGAMFDVSRMTVRRVFYTMTKLHHDMFKEEFFLLHEEALKAIIPDMMKTFREHEGVDTSVAHIIDGFERRMEKPQDDEAAAACWSTYKHLYTAKFLLGILSSGAAGARLLCES